MTGYPIAQLTELTESEWRSITDENEYKRLMEDPWLQRKLDRQRRLREHVAYLGRTVPWLPMEPPGVVVDIGPGAGELLEICRHLNHEVVGLDSIDGMGGMGSRYVRACYLLTRRQGLDIVYNDALTDIGALLAAKPGALQLKLYPQQLQSFGDAVLINARGSIEQVFSQDMVGTPHHIHHDAKQLAWRLTDKLVRQRIGRFMTWASRKLRDGGRLVIHFNGSENHEDALTEFSEQAYVAGLLVAEESDGDRLIVWEKGEGRHEQKEDCTCS